MATKNFCWTINNYTDDDVNRILKWAKKNEKKNYVIFSKEVGEGGTPHLQGYCHFEQARATLPKTIFPRARAAKCGGTAEENITYITKECREKYNGTCPEGHCVSFGEKPMDNGVHRGLVAAQARVNAGTRVNTLRQEDPMLYHQYGRTLEKLEQDYNATLRRSWKTDGVWYYGPTGTGKSHRAMDGYDAKTHYVWCSEDKGWWDGYNGQDIVVIEEVRKETLAYPFLLKLLDKWPLSVTRRHLGPTPFLARKIIFTSPLHPADIYQRHGEQDSIEQLLRRLAVVQLTERYDEMKD